MLPVDSAVTALSHVRETEFPGLAGVYLDAASITPLPERSRLATEEFNRVRARIHTMTGDDFIRPVHEARSACARLIGADASEIALGPNTSFGINVAALGLDIPHGSTVLVPEREFPANVYPWMNRERFVLERVPTDPSGWPDEDRILERLRDPNVSVLAISSVQFANGYRVDLQTLGETCRAENVILVVDAIQSLGQLPLDVTNVPIDIMAAGGHKWLCGPLGTGFLYVRTEMQSRLTPEGIGWASMRASERLESLVEYEWDFLPDARRYEEGTAPLQDLVALSRSIELLLEVGVAEIERYLDELLQPLRTWALERCPGAIRSEVASPHRSAIFSISPRRLEEASRQLRAAGVVCSVREGGIRFAPHLYNTAAEIGRALEALEGCEREGLL